MELLFFIQTLHINGQFKEKISKHRTRRSIICISQYIFPKNTHTHTHTRSVFKVKMSSGLFKPTKTPPTSAVITSRSDQIRGLTRTKTMSLANQI